MWEDPKTLPVAPTPTASATPWGAAPPLPAGLEGDLGSVQEDSAAELQLQGEGDLGASGAGWVHGVTGEGGPRGGPGGGGPHPLPWPVSGRRGSQRCRAGGDPPAPCTPASPGWRPAEGGTSPVAGWGQGWGQSWGWGGSGSAQGRGVLWGHMDPSGGAYGAKEPPAPTGGGLGDACGAKGSPPLLPWG